MNNLQLAIRRVHLIGQGTTINGAYKMCPNDALEAFRKDLLLITDALEPEQQKAPPKRG